MLRAGLLLMTAVAAYQDQAAPERFDERIAREGGGPLHASGIHTIQVNIGLTCNLACRHCHVASSPRRTEQMSWDTAEHILRAAREARAETVDITGGAPEMNPHFRRFVRALRAQGQAVMVRTNLTIMLEDGYGDLPDFFRDHGVRLVASLPCYLEQNVDQQRGSGVYQGSVEALQCLNAVGYGIDPALELNLVYNPLGPSLPPPQATLEADYRRELEARFGIRFTHLHVITNMPIGRFFGDLRSEHREEEYMQLLRQAFNPATINGLMCRQQVSVDWDGRLHDCDFNLALKLGLAEDVPAHIRDFDAAALARRPILTGDHCYGCTAGCGSSCGGALVGD